MCGENAIRDAIYMQVAGSSPRVRGKLGRSDLEGSEQRLIPACAGKTRAADWIQKFAEAHPRVCGENHRGCLTMPAPTGSSPRVRGKLQR